MREYVSIAVRNNVHFVLYRYWVDNRSIFTWNVWKSQWIWSWLEIGRPEPMILTSVK